jgi:ATP phosphoribosyltransferase
MLGDSLGMRASDRGLWYESADLVAVCARSADLPYLVDMGLVDLAVTGYDYVVEAELPLAQLADTGYQRCSVAVLGGPWSADWRERRELTVVSQYPRTARAYFERCCQADVTIYSVSGAAELYARCRAADLIVDAYMTGDTAGANGLEVFDTILETSGRVFARSTWQEEGKDIVQVVERLGFGLLPPAAADGQLNGDRRHA